MHSTWLQGSYNCSKLSLTIILHSIFHFFRNSEKWQRSQLDLCVVVFRTRSAAQPQVGRLVEHSKRQVRGFVGCHKMLEQDHYILVCLAFNHWHTGKSKPLSLFLLNELAFPRRHVLMLDISISGMDDPASYPDYVLAIHSSKKLLVEQITPPSFVLADAIISLTLAKGQRHEVMIPLDYCMYLHVFVTIS